MIDPMALVYTTNTKGLIPLAMAVLASMVSAMIQPSTTTMAPYGTTFPNAAFNPLPISLSLYSLSLSMVDEGLQFPPIYNVENGYNFKKEEREYKWRVTLHENVKLLRGELATRIMSHAYVGKSIHLQYICR